MARKRTEIALQVEIESQEEWEEMLAKEGLTVVDIYQEWCGPTKSMISNFRRLKNEIGDDLLRFCVAKSDTVDALEKYRGRCQPCFLFFAGGVLVSVIRGANSPLLIKTIMEQLAYEHKVLDGSAERKEIRDPLLADIEDRERAAEEEDEEEEGAEEVVKKGVTVAIIKPNVVEEGKVEEVMEKMREAGIEILEHTERQLTEEEARTFYNHRADEEYFEELVKFMSGGPCHVLVLTKGDTGEGIIDEWRELLGPASVEEAKEQAPQSLRAQFGKETYVNAVHGSDSKDRAMAELAFFFPDYHVPTFAKGKKPKVQRTLALIRPDALREKKEEILAKIEEAGFQVAMQKEMQLTKEQAEEFYKEHQDQPYFDALTQEMSSGPMLALCLAREDAITKWRDMLGPAEVEKAKEEAPHSLRAQFSVEDIPVNQLHGSDSPQAATNEINRFFPMQQTVAVIKPDAYQTQNDIMERIREAGFHIAARKETELTVDIAKQFYKDLEGRDYYDDLTEHMASGPNLFMVLSREDAVDGWRSLIGPTDPNAAKEQAPSSLRAEFGTDIKANAVHGSSNPQHAEESMKLIFGDIEFNTDEGERAAGTEQQKGGDEQTEQTEQATEGEEEKHTEETDEQKEEGEKEGETEEHKEEDATQEQQETDGEKDGEASEQKAETDEQNEAPETEQQAESEETKAEEGGDSADQKEGDGQKEDGQGEESQEGVASKEPVKEETSTEEPAAEQTAKEEQAEEETAKEEPAEEKTEEDGPSAKETAELEPAEEKTEEVETSSKETAEPEPAEEKTEKEDAAEEGGSSEKETAEETDGPSTATEEPAAEAAAEEQKPSEEEAKAEEGQATESEDKPGETSETTDDDKKDEDKKDEEQKGETEEKPPE